MINKLTDGIIAAIKEEFGDGYEIYQENIEQELTEPCFLVSCISPHSEHHIGSTYERRHLFMVQYFPGSRAEPRAECMDVADRLFLCLEYIAADGLKRGTGMNTEVVDGVLQFQVNYDFLVRMIKDEEDRMEGIETDVGVKGE